MYNIIIKILFLLDFLRKYYILYTCTIFRNATKVCYEGKVSIYIINNLNTKVSI